MGLEGIDEAARLIQNGDIVAFATETVYGLGADAFNPQAIKKIFIAKGRPLHNPLTVHLSKIVEVDKVAIVTEEATTLLKAFSPGPLTLVLKKRKGLPSIVTAGLDTVGIRIPNNDIARQLIEKANTPVAAPSANISMRLSPTTAKHVYDDMKGRIPLIIDGGDCKIGIESTVLDLTRKYPTILRPGTITLEMLLEYLPDIRYNNQNTKISTTKHYIPNVDCVLARTAESAIIEYQKAVSQGKSTVIIGRKGFIKDKSVNFVTISDSIVTATKDLYKLLRELEERFDYIIIELLPQEVAYPLRNRLYEITQGVII